MTYEIALPLLVFAFVSSITPGPNNLMLMTSGVNFGFRPTIPHMLGIGIGFGVMLILVGLGLLQVFDRFPVLYQILKAVSVVYLLYLAYRIATTTNIGRADCKSRPMSFFAAALFQWVNPKAWTMALTALTVYMPHQTMIWVLVVSAAFAAVNLPCVSVWTVLGTQLRRFLGTPARLRSFNVTMALLLVASLYPVLQI